MNRAFQIIQNVRDIQSSISIRDAVRWNTAESCTILQNCNGDYYRLWPITAQILLFLIVGKMSNTWRISCSQLGPGFSFHVSDECFHFFTHGLRYAIINSLAPHHVDNSHKTYSIYYVK